MLNGALSKTANNETTIEPAKKGKIPNEGPPSAALRSGYQSVFKNTLEKLMWLLKKMAKPLEAIKKIIEIVSTITRATHKKEVHLPINSFFTFFKFTAPNTPNQNKNHSLIKA
ncbi:MAG: hypothetical protein Kow00111_22120 [Thermincola ferriacetica]